ncbi:Ribosome maturation factor RimM [bioreactor metagenome]|uniref:Ribosome maturation factor RimM n=1 Tax=bioreactor metagenome TaxID=1076179 RepID=A0A645FL47_9ZZZZ|nr:ribosome maturation factor RimM [Candidatus Pelethousia sp.]
MDEYLRVGMILRPHGVHGAVKILPLTSDNRRFFKLNEAYIERNGVYERVQAMDISVQPDAVFLRLSICESREEAETLRGLYLCVDRVHAVKLPEGRYFVADMIGCEVEDSHGTPLGKLTNVLETGANDVYVIQGKRKLLVPALKKLLQEVDVEKKRIVLNAQVLEEVGLFED